MNSVEAEVSKWSERRIKKVKNLNLAAPPADMEGSESYEDVASCEKLLESMQSLRPLLNGGGNSHDMFHTFQMMTGAGSTFSAAGSAVVDPSPSAISADDLEILESPTMLNSYEHDMLLSSLGTSSSNLSISCDELSPRLEHSDKWNLPSESNYPIWKLHQDFSTPGEHGNFLSQSTGNAREISHTTKAEADRREIKWRQEAGKQKTDTRMDTALPHHLSGAESKGLNAVDSHPRLGFSRVNSSNDLMKQLDSSDNSDAMEDGDEGGKQSQGKAPMSKNLVSERRRRKKLNERLYSLRAIVPKISKMDKASIVGDAISYVRDLQKQVEEMQTDIESLQSTTDALAEGIVDPKKDAKRSGARGNQVLEEHRILELEVSQMEEQTYHLRIHCKKSPGVLVQLTRALEALDFEIVNANLTSVNDHILNTIVVKIKNGEELKPEELRKMTLEVIPKFGLFI